MHCSGKMRIDKSIVNLACNSLSISRDTIYRHLRWLKGKNWIGYSKQSKLYFIRSFKYVTEKESLEGRTCAVFRSDWFDSFKAFLSGSIIGYLVKHQRKTERKKRRSNQSRPVATSAISKIMNIPESTAYHLKVMAHKAGFITKRRDYTFTGVHIKYLKEFRRCNSEIAYKVIGYKNEVCICMPDLITNNMRFKTNRSL